jgi:cellulose synthase/poly-beta-1,6-N-acetylglucosamine synthase-like glycosyltransferase
VLDVFFADSETTACVQAQLSIDNTRDGWLARMFTAEYAGLFDVLLPGLARLRLPLPLGGSSNHFRTRILRNVGGWDAYNVTEDADLGMRLARAGYHAAVIESTTFEEAPYQLRHWLPQRTRWFKGWIQTWAVHMREPIRLARDLGWAGFATLQLVVGGTVLAALVHPLFLAWLTYSVATDGWSPLASLYGISIAAGYAASILLAFVGLARRRLLSQSLILLLTPVHWMLLSLAAWRALGQFVFDPYKWEKTTHGLARTSRAAEAATRR